MDCSTPGFPVHHQLPKSLHFQPRQEDRALQVAATRWTPKVGSQVLNPSSLSLGIHHGLLETSFCFGIWNPSLGLCNSSYCTVYRNRFGEGLWGFSAVKTLGWGPVCEPVIISIFYHYSKSINNKFPQSHFHCFVFLRGSKKGVFLSPPQFLFFSVFIAPSPFITKEGIMTMTECTIKSGYRKQRTKKQWFMERRECKEIRVRELERLTYTTTFSISESDTNVLISSCKNSAETISFQTKYRLTYLNIMIIVSVFNTYAQYNFSYNFEICNQYLSFTVS